MMDHIISSPGNFDLVFEMLLCFLVTLKKFIYNKKMPRQPPFLISTKHHNHQPTRLAPTHLPLPPLSVCWICDRPHFVPSFFLPQAADRFP